MHELSVCQALIEQVDQVAKENYAESVDQIIVQIGPLSGIESKLLLNAYGIARMGTIAEDAMLEIEAMPIKIRCLQCNQQSEVLVNKLICPHCGDYKTQLISGDEMILKTIGLVSVKEKH
ncbi:MAG: hydrogenase maturation nickel metallochaperone HypA [Methylococcales bacterium]|jgi:hydrogenase nickel incorporation protein HypA/HybF|nr:hydrogenase maturation nickel metallochaperone HypA [Methylococcales bacterium]